MLLHAGSGCAGSGVAGCAPTQWVLALHDAGAVTRLEVSELAKLDIKATIKTYSEVEAKICEFLNKADEVALDKVFALADGDQDGKITWDEFAAAASDDSMGNALA